MVSKIKGPRNYLSCCHVLTAMGRGQRADGASRKSPGWRAHGTQAGRAPATHSHPQTPPFPPLAQGWGLGYLPEPGLGGRNGGGGSAFAQLLSPDPSKLWEGGVLSVLLAAAAEGLCGLGRGERRESGVPLLSAPLPWQVMVPRHPREGWAIPGSRAGQRDCGPRRSPVPHRCTNMHIRNMLTHV